LIADVNAANRKLLEDLVYRVRALESPPREAGDAFPAYPRPNDRPGRWEH